MAAASLGIEVLTPRGAGGVAVVRLTGQDRHVRAALLLARATGDTELPLCVTEVPRLARLVVDGHVLDQVLAFDRPTLGAIEIHLHGAEAVLDALEPHLIWTESTESLPPAERLLRRAASEAQLALALEQRGHDFDAYCDQLADLPPCERAVEVAAARRRSAVARAICEPQRIVLCGVQNAGKSTLLNRLSFRERALTGALPGLTRDPVREIAELGGYLYELVDTAGEPAADVHMPLDVDRRSIELARAERDSDVLRVLVLDVTRGFGAIEGALYRERRTLIVCNKIDLCAPGAPELRARAPSVAVSCLEPGDAPRVRMAIGTALTRLRGLPERPGALGGPAALDGSQRARLLRVDAGLSRP